MDLAELLIDENVDQVLAMNTRFEIIAWNKTCELVTGVKKNEITGKNIFEFFPAMKADRAVYDALKAGLQGLKSFIPYDRLAANGFVEMHVIPLKDEQDAVTGILMIKHDVAHRIKAELELKALNKSLENFKRIIDSAHDVVITFDVNGNVTYWNKAAENLFGYKPYEILGKPMAQLLPESSRHELAGIFENLKSNAVADLIVKQKTKSEEEIDVVVNIFPLIDENNTFIGGCKIAKDITQILKYQESIEALNKELLLKNRRLASVHAELKTFNDIAVNNYNETLRQLYLHFEYIAAHEAIKLSDPGKANIRKAQAAIQKMKLLTNDIIAFTRLNEFDTESKTVDLNIVVKTVIDELRQAHDIINADFMVGVLPVIKGFPFLVSLVFHHLVENAIKFRPEKGRLTVTISAEQDVKGDRIKHNDAHKGTTYNIITVHDNGIGFPQEQWENVFQIFTRLNAGKYRGSGIGLAICRKAMELHNGFITVMSDTGKGSSFSCYFPAE